MQNAGFNNVDFTSDSFFAKDERDTCIKRNENGSKSVPKAPPRMISDLLINGFFQEYHPLFPVLHRPTFLGLYENLVNQESCSPKFPRDNHELAQLYLVFAIASSQTEVSKPKDQKR